MRKCKLILTVLVSLAIIACAGIKINEVIPKVLGGCLTCHPAGFEEINGNDFANAKNEDGSPAHLGTAYDFAMDITNSVELEGPQ